MTGSQPSSKIKILYVITQGEFGGAQRYVFDLATHLNRNDYEILVLVGAEKPDLKIKLEEQGIRVIPVKNLVRNIHPLRELLAIFELRKIFRREKPNLIHLNSSKAGVLGSFAARLAGMKNVIFTAHGFAFLEPHSWPVKYFYFWAEKIATSFRKKIICVSDYDRQAATKAELCRPEKIITIHNGIAIDDSKFLTKEAARNSLDSKFLILNSDFLIGTIANLYPTKGIKYLIDAAKEVVAKFSTVKFMVIGEGKKRKNLELRIKNLGLRDNFFLLGQVPNAEDYLHKFNLFVLPSLKEGFPYTILEAMQAGLPIVATRVGGIPEAISNEKQGLLVPPKDKKALANALLRLLKNPQLACELGENAKARAKDFTLEKMIAKTEKIYETLQNSACPPEP
jgi:glycosyltransferase involved in cell wall biosynthesis